MIRLNGDSDQGSYGEREMRSTQQMLDTAPRRSLAWIMAPVVFALMAIQPQPVGAQQSEPKSFSSAGEAARALHAAVDAHDEQAVESILGAGKDVTSTSDDGEDKVEREHFCQKFEEMHRLVKEPDGTTVLYIGAENWPFPIPLTSRNGRWFFDAETGKQELMFRRIGEDEAAAIEVARALTAAGTAQAADAGSDDPIRQFAERMALRAGAGNSTDTASATEQHETFYGYYFRTLSGPAATTTAGTDGNASRASRLAFVAYPAEYRSSGVMTFIVTKDGVVYEKDLGPETARLATDIHADKPAKGWRVVK